MIEARVTSSFRSFHEDGDQDQHLEEMCWGSGGVHRPRSTNCRDPNFATYPGRMAESNYEDDRLPRHGPPISLQWDTWNNVPIGHGDYHLSTPSAHQISNP